MRLLSDIILCALLAPLARAWSKEYRGALYVLSQTIEQKLVVSALFENGTADFVTSVSTGGHGPGDRGPDPLQAADGLVVNNDRLFAVNPGSNELSIFAINPEVPWELKKLGNNTYTGGDYPTSIAVSPDGLAACVTNSGKNNNVRCFSLDGSSATLLPDFDFKLSLDQSNPPVGPPKTPSDLHFSSNGQELYVTVKGSGDPTQSPAGRIEVFGVQGLNFTHTATTYAGFGPGGLPFSITPVADSSAMLLTDPAGGIDIVRFEPGGFMSYNATFKIPGQSASCWSAYSAATGQYFTADIATSLLTALAINSTTLETSLLSTYNVTTALAQPGAPVDLRVAHFSDEQDYLYSLSATDQVIRIFSLPASQARQTEWKLVQAYEIGAAFNETGGTVGTSIEGMAVYLKQ